MLKRRLLPSIIIPAVLLTLSCSGVDKVKTSLVTITVGSAESATLKAEPKTAWNRAVRYFSGLLQTTPAVAAIPSIVTDVRVTVTAADIETAITTTVPVAGLPDVTITLEVPNGPARTFAVEGLDAAGTPNYSGFTRVDLTGEPVSLTITLTLPPSVVTPVDAVPPTFAGLHFTSVISISSTTLNWDPATDNASTAANITYLVYQSTTPGGEVFTAPTYTVPAGATSFGVANLIPGTTYYFVVRAMDQAGNIDTNTAEFSFVYPGKYVNGTTGIDVTGCGTQAAPCNSIDFAISLSAGNEGIFVSAGTYTVPVNGIVLKAGTQLACVGPNFTTVISPSTTISIRGSQGALIDGCRIDAPPLAVAAINDNATDITVNNCLIQGDGLGTQLGISLGANSIVKNSTLALIKNVDSIGEAITVQSGNPIISGNTITGSGTGINVVGGNPTISGNTISNNSNGIDLPIGAGAQSPIIRGNTISGNAVNGISVTGGIPLIDNNQINTNVVGILVSLVSPTITNNTINNNTTGITVNGSAGTNPVITGNSIFCNTALDLNDVALSPFDASNNSWDHPAPAPVPSIAGACPGGTDICISGPAPTLSPYGPVVAAPCSP
jgi:parallel beta-helix repeat protein